MESFRDAGTMEQIARFLPLVQERLSGLSVGIETGIGLSGAQISLVEYLHRNGESSVAILTRALRRAQSSISELVDRLEEKGLVQRRGAQDRRKTLISLSSSGRRWMLERKQLHRSALVQLLDGLDGNDQQALLHHLSQLLSLTDQVSLVKQLRNRTPLGRPLISYQ
jgi:DNA-binding MarR family transcriptional regulator